jgi:hypothetical protein
MKASLPEYWWEETAGPGLGMGSPRGRARRKGQEQMDDRLIVALSLYAKSFESFILPCP